VERECSKIVAKIDAIIGVLLSLDNCTLYLTLLSYALIKVEKRFEAETSPDRSGNR
jgi:hypothetical protein